MRYKGIATIKVNITPGIAFNNTTHTGKFKIIDNSSLDTKLPNTLAKTNDSTFIFNGGVNSS